MSVSICSSHEDTLLAIDNLGRVMSCLFPYDDARELHSKAVTGMKRTLGPTHLSTLVAIENLAMVYLQIGEGLLSSGHDSMVQVLEERKKKLG